MKRILLLTERRPDFGTAQCLQQLHTGLAGDYDFDHVALPEHGLVRQLLRASHLRQRAQGAHCVHAFGFRAMQVASTLLALPVLYTPLPDDPSKAVRWVRAAMARREIRILSLGIEEDRLFVSGGVAAEACHLTRPGTRLGRGDAPDPAIRQQLGLTPEHHVVLAVGDSHRYANHTMALHTVATLASINPRWRLLLWGEGPAADGVRQLHREWEIDVLTDAQAILGAGVEFAAVVKAASYGLVTAPERLALAPLLTCMAQGLPLVAPATRAVADILEDRHTAILYAPTTMRMAAQRLLALSEDRPLAARLADQARAEVYELFSVSRFLDSVRQLYG